jgi:putative membrane protein
VVAIALILTLLILAIRWFLRAERGAGVTPSGPPSGPDPLQILRERYARGEIDDEEYERRRKILGG